MKPIRTNIAVSGRIFVAIAVATFSFQTAGAITPGQVDDFQDGTTMSWGRSATANIADAGPDGVDDHALDVDRGSRPVVTNEDQWQGDWTGAGVTALTFDVLSPTSNGTDMNVWLGISAGTLPAFGGAGDTYVSSESQAVPSDGQWHNVSFDVTAAGWTDFAGNDIASALTDVFQLRILHNPIQSYIGEGDSLVSDFLLDNIRAVPEPTSVGLLLLTLAVAGTTLWRRRRS